MEEVEERLEKEMPEIQMEDGTVIRGCDCFWLPVEVAEDIKKNSKEYTINVKVKGYGGLAMNVKVLAKNPDDATHLACSQEQRYQDDDPYVLIVYVNDNDDTSVFCTYQTLDEGLDHIKTITAGRWVLAQRDEEGEGAVLKTWEDHNE
jgi:hypothetical protein